MELLPFPRILILISLTLIILGLIPLYHPFYRYPMNLVVDHSSKISSPLSYHTCNVFIGDWIPNPEAPYYTNRTCWAIHEHQNCMKYGRPDTEFLKWRWKPKGCELPIFNPYQFLDMMRNKSMAFIGDSVGRNQMQSLICLLSRNQIPMVLAIQDFSIFILMNLDPKWTTQIEQFDYPDSKFAHRFTRCSVYYEKNQIIGCRYCGIPNVTELPINYGYRKALKTTLKAINNLEKFKGITFLRTIAPSHFEGGEWNKGGNCVRKGPFRSNETTLDDISLEFYKTQVEEFKIAAEEGKEKDKRFRLLDMTQAMWLRPDGHPSKYGHWSNANVVLYNDCVHWCLPGPIDSWSDFLLHMLKLEGRRALEENLQLKKVYNKNRNGYPFFICLINLFNKILR
ncbi:unnamed protein product [Withania somnifera]